MQVRIAFVTGPDGQIDVNRVGTIEDHPTEEAKRLIAAGIAAKPTERELADWDIERQRRDEARTAELSELTKADLLEQVPDGAEVPKGATKEDLVAAIVKAEHAPTGTGTNVEGSEAPIVTAAPGSMAGDSAGPGDNVDTGTAATDPGDTGTAPDTGTTTSRTGRRTR